MSKSSSSERGNIGLVLIIILAVAAVIVVVLIAAKSHHSSVSGGGVQGYADCDRGDLREHDVDCGYSRQEQARCKSYLKKGYKSCPPAQRRKPASRRVIKRKPSQQIKPRGRTVCKFVLKNGRKVKVCKKI